MNSVFTNLEQQIRNRCRVSAVPTRSGEDLHHIVHLAGRADFAEAAELIQRFGDYAASEAQLRASRSRDLGNLVSFCRWREVERLIGTLNRDAPGGATH